MKSPEDEFGWVGDHVPCFATSGENVHILKYPKQFYSEILTRASNSQRRVVLAALYLGTGEQERDLMATLEHLLESNRDVSVHLLLDYNRGTRRDGPTKPDTSCSLVAPLLAKFGNEQRVKLHLFHSPKLRGLVKRILPARWNEIVGLQHMKLYIFDDTLLISGANLSETYFTNRQDRYVMVEDCKPLADFYADIVDAVGQCSFQTSRDGVTQVLDGECDVHPFEDNEDAFMRMFRQRIQHVVEKYRQSSAETTGSGDTLVYPLVQYGHAGVNYENLVLTRTLNTQPCTSSQVLLASGYFNLTSNYADPLLTGHDVTVLAAAPQANGFWGASGISGFIPAMYTYVAAGFIARASRSGAYMNSVRLLEYKLDQALSKRRGCFSRPNWTFHAKGLWLNKPDTGCTYATFAGSTNYGYRSDHRDLEAQLLIVTKNADLQRRLKDEQQYLLHYGSTVDKTLLQRADHHVPVWLRLIARFIRHFF